VTGPKLNEAPVIRRRPESKAHAVSTPTPSARAIARHVRVSPYKVREVLDLIRGHEVRRAQDILRLCERDAAFVVGKLVASAMANAEHNHALVTDELFVSACFADEGPTLKRWRPRARGRATRIRKRTTHVTVIVSRLPESELRQRRAERAQASSGRRGGPRRTPAATGRPDRGGAGRGRRRDQLSTSTPSATGIDTRSFGTEAEPLTDRPEVRTEGPAAGGAATTHAPDDDTPTEGVSTVDAEDKE